MWWGRPTAPCSAHDTVPSQTNKGRIAAALFRIALGRYFVATFSTGFFVGSLPPT